MKKKFNMYAQTFLRTLYIALLLEYSAVQNLLRSTRSFEAFCPWMRGDSSIRIFRTKPVKGSKVQKKPPEGAGTGREKVQIEIKGTAEEIADFVLAEQNRQDEMMAPLATIKEVAQKAIDGIAQEAQAAL